jgi:hypothetical protein
MRSISRLASAALVTAALMVGCSSSSNNNDGSMGGGIQPTDKLVDLSTADRHTVCLQESANGTGAVSCPDAGAVPVAIGVCTSLQPDCSATVATSQTCTAKLMADACDFKAYSADLKTPECMVMLECTASLCTNAMFLCPNADMLNTAQVTCKTLTRGLTTDCASCISGVFTGLTCPDFSNLAAPYDQCAAACTQTSGGG